MAPIASTVALSHVEGISDSARARELYKYYQPNASISYGPGISTPPVSIASSDDVAAYDDVNVQSNVTSSKISSPDTALTSFCQLVTWRTGVQRAMISLIDAQTQYFIAESTKTVDLIDNTKYAPGDEIWIGCSSVPKAGRLCERTIEVTPTQDGEYPSFIVNDLSRDERFNQLPFVTSSPFLKFYAGVPLITKRGIAIGSLFIVDDHVRNGLTKDEVHFMGTIAGTIMKHFEMTREVEEHRRGMKMSRGLASFVEGRAELAEADADAEDGEGTKVAGQFETGFGRSKSKSSTQSSSLVGSVASERKEREYASAILKTEGIPTSHDTSEVQSSSQEILSQSQPTSFGSPAGATNASASSRLNDPVENTASSPEEDTSELSTIRILFSRAANLIREAFEVDGGAVFYDAQRGFSNDVHQSGPSGNHLFRHESTGSGDDLRLSSDVQSDTGEGTTLPQTTTGTPLSPRSTLLGEGIFSRNSLDSEKAVEVLGFSTAVASSVHGDEYPGPDSFIPFDEKSLHTLLRRFPRGKLWTFDSEGVVSSSSDDDIVRRYRKVDPLQRNKDTIRRRKRNSRNLSDARFLLRHFPGVRQLLFVPLWDASRSRWLSCCCAWSTEPTRILSRQNELAFLTAFGNSVMAECSRIDTEIADQKKGDFIGSISHELRSPLHGILASAEFLNDEVTEGFAKGLVETIDSCGRTLLDTINHILDFSKINHFEKNWRKSKRASTRPVRQTGSSGLTSRPPEIPMINLFADVDISVVCEEVVESVFAGHVFQNVTAQSFDMVPDALGKMSDPKKYIASSDPMMTSGRVQDSEVAVILDVDIQNYHFTTQPGAFRRIIMNLLGNALKYTSHGYVRIKLDATEIDDLHTPGSSDSTPRSLVVLTIQDTGRGIATEFLRSKLFTPFAQENSLSSGTGLGLSIVRSIVSLLEGDIQIDSEQGHGTQVRVTLPLLREIPRNPDSAATGTPKSVSSMPRETDQSVSLLRARVIGQKVALYGFDLDKKNPIIYQMGQLLKASITNFLTKWYGLQVVPLGQKVGIIVANEADPATITKLAKSSGQRKSPSILVLCSYSSRFNRSVSQSKTDCNCGFISKPVGPLKLARALLQCLEGRVATPSLLSDPIPTVAESNDLSNVFEELTLHPHYGEVLDNSRMTADSDNARKAIESPTPNAVTERHSEFPFPVHEKPPGPKVHGMPGDKDDIRSALPGSTKDTRGGSLVQTNTENTSTEPQPSAISLPSPRLLLVDDNKINLNLLRTYMHRRKYSIVDEAENGFEAVKQVQKRDERHEPGYDIIFMDISMPVLDGFGATRQIRALEESRLKKILTLNNAAAASSTGTEEKTPAQIKIPTPALIIALTGLAGSRDQSEAFTSGIDLFLTKPVSFKEVGKMLDNWEANMERDLKGGGMGTGSSTGTS